MFPRLTHPLRMGLVILWSTVCISLIAGLNFSSIWLSYTLILVILGALLVIFIYVSLLSSNEIFIKSSNLLTFGNAIFSLLLSGTLSFLDPFNSTHFQNTNSFTNIESHGIERLSMLYSDELGLFTIFLICYLLVTLIVVVFITQDDKSTLRAQMR